LGWFELVIEVVFEVEGSVEIGVGLVKWAKELSPGVD
jgi:hypothetical protein